MIKRGFSLVETVLVLGLAGVLMALVFSSLPGLYSTSRNQSRIKSSENISIALSSYLANTNYLFPVASDYTNSYSSTSSGGTKWLTHGVNLGPETKDGGVVVFNQTRDLIRPNIDSIWIFKQSLCPSIQAHEAILLRTENTSILRYAVIIKLEVSNVIYCVNN